MLPKGLGAPSAPPKPGIAPEDIICDIIFMMGSFSMPGGRPRPAGSPPGGPACSGRSKPSIIWRSCSSDSDGSGLGEKTPSIGLRDVFLGAKKCSEMSTSAGSWCSVAAGAVEEASGADGVVVPESITMDHTPISTMSEEEQRETYGRYSTGYTPPVTRPPTPVIFSSLEDPPALIFASLRSLRSRACSAARWAAASASLVVAVSAIFEVCGSFSWAVMYVSVGSCR